MKIGKLTLFLSSRQLGDKLVLLRKEILLKIYASHISPLSITQATKESYVALTRYLANFKLFKLINEKSRKIVGKSLRRSLVQAIQCHVQV